MESKYPHSRCFLLEREDHRALCDSTLEVTAVRRPFWEIVTDLF